MPGQQYKYRSTFVGPKLPELASGFKYCKTCCVIKPTEEFHKKNTCKDGLDPKCDLCLNKYRSDRYRNFPHVREYVRSCVEDWRERHKGYVAPKQKSEIAAKRLQTTTKRVLRILNPKPKKKYYYPTSPEERRTKYLENKDKVKDFVKTRVDEIQEGYVVDLLSRHDPIAREAINTLKKESFTKYITLVNTKRAQLKLLRRSENGDSRNQSNHN